MLEEIVGRACRDLAVQVKAVAATFAAAARPVEIPDVEVTAHSQESSEMCDDYYEKMGQLAEKARQDGGPSCAEYLKFLSVTTEVTQRCLALLGKAASLASKVEGRYECREPSACIAEFLEDYYDLLDPEGVKERHTQNKIIENRLCEVEVNYLGHLLVGNPETFALELGGGPPGVKAQLLSIAGEMISRSPVMSQRDYEEAYDSCSNVAFSWQECLDDELLLTVRGLLRQHIQAGMLYSSFDSDGTS
jgi:hypothetical protein